MTKVEKTVAAAVKVCAEHDVTPDQLAVALLERGESLGRGKVWNRSPARSEAYKRFITARFPCALTGVHGTQAAHMNWTWRYERPGYGRAIKTDDLRCVPLTPEMHRRVDAKHYRLSAEERIWILSAMVDCLVAWCQIEGRNA